MTDEEKTDLQDQEVTLFHGLDRALEEGSSEPTPGPPKETRSQESGAGKEDEPGPFLPASECPRTPLDPTPLPSPRDDGSYDLLAPECYLNRELTWLNFNYRVLHQARDPRIPLLERQYYFATVKE